jgi:hypothetical protein
VDPERMELLDEAKRAHPAQGFPVCDPEQVFPVCGPARGCPVCGQEVESLVCHRFGLGLYVRPRLEPCGHAIAEALYTTDVDDEHTFGWSWQPLDPDSLAP